jgi:hypothetical protein
MTYQPRYQWKRTQIDENDPPTDLDWCGFDGDQYIGRIRKETAGPTKGRWHWAGSFPRSLRGRTIPTPNSGHADTARQATQKVEEYWDSVSG